MRTLFYQTPNLALGANWSTLKYICLHYMHKMTSTHRGLSQSGQIWTREGAVNSSYSGRPQTTSSFTSLDNNCDVLLPGNMTQKWARCYTVLLTHVYLRNSLGQTVHTHCAFVHQAAKLVAAVLRVAGVTVGLAESNGSLPPSLWLTSPVDWLPRTGISSGTLRSVIEYGLPLH